MGEVRPWDLLNKSKPRATEEVQKARLTICESCERYLKSTNQCRECGCIMPLKTKLHNAECPLGKW